MNEAEAWEFWNATRMEFIKAREAAVQAAERVRAAREAEAAAWVGWQAVKDEGGQA